MNRRNFIKTSGSVGSVAVLSNILPVNSLHASNQQERKMAADFLLKDVCDIHIHKSSFTEALDLSHKAKDAGYKAVMLKLNVWPCHEQAAVVQQTIPDFQCFSSLVMNLAFGNRVNPYVVEQALRTAGNL